MAKYCLVSIHRGANCRGVYKEKQSYIYNNIMLLILSDCLSCTLILNDQKIAQLI